MGLTIHYSGTLPDPNSVMNLVEDVKDFCNVMKWNYNILDDDWSEPVECSTVIEDGCVRIKGNLGLKGISISIHPDCERLAFLFDSQGRIVSLPGRIVDVEDCFTDSVKTQFAPVEVHITIIKILRFIKNNYIPDLAVLDEGEYWETGNLKNLISKMRFLSEMIEKISAGLDVPGGSDLSPEELADFIEKRIQAIFDENREKQGADQASIS